MSAMNEAESALPPKGRGKIQQDAEDGARNPQPALHADKIRLFGVARALLVGGEVTFAGHRKIIYAARRKLMSGDFLNPETLQRTAENLLRSGDLDA